MNWEQLLEAERQGTLPADKKAMLDEARERGLLLGNTGFGKAQRNANAPQLQWPSRVPPLGDEQRVSFEVTQTPAAERSLQSEDDRNLEKLKAEQVRVIREKLVARRQRARDEQGLQDAPKAERSKERELALASAIARAKKAKQGDGGPVDPELAETSRAGLAGELMNEPPRENELMGGVLPSPRQAVRNLKENLLGDDDPNTLNRGETLGQFLNSAGESMTLGVVGDEADAALRSTLTGDSYDKTLDRVRQQEAVFDRDHPVASLAAEVAPLALPGVGAANWVGRARNLPHLMARGGAVAGAQGGLYGFTEGEGGLKDRATEAAKAGTVSGGLGGALAPVARGVQRGLDNRKQKAATKAMVRNAPSADDLSNRATQLYAKGESRGRVLTPEAAKGLEAEVLTALREKGLMRSNGQLITRDQDVRRIVKEMQDVAKFGLEGNQVKPVRAMFQAAAQDRDPMRARIGTILLGKFDDAVKRNAPEFAEGDALYHRMKKAEGVDQMMDLADTSETANALRREFQKFDRRNIKGQAGSMTADEAEAMRQAARAGRVSGAIGRSAPRSLSGAIFTGGTPFMAGTLAGSPAIGAAVGLGAMGLGAIGRAHSNRSQKGAAEIARALMLSGGKMPKATEADATKKLIAQILMGLGSRQQELRDAVAAP